MIIRVSLREIFESPLLYSCVTLTISDDYIDSHIPANSICISIYTVQQISYHFTILTIAQVDVIVGKIDIMYIGFI